MFPWGDNPFVDIFSKFFQHLSLLFLGIFSFCNLVPKFARISPTFFPCRSADSRRAEIWQFVVPTFRFAEAGLSHASGGRAGHD